MIKSTVQFNINYITQLQQNSTNDEIEEFGRAPYSSISINLLMHI